MRNGNAEWISNEECEFDYRRSIFHKHPDWIILAVRLKLERKSQDEIRTLMDNRRQRRMESQPLDFPSAGSVFRNTDSKPAWQFIEELGWRGKNIGGAMVSSKHTNFIINYNHATAADFMALANAICQSVKEKYDVDLIMEVEKFNW